MGFPETLETPCIHAWVVCTELMTHCKIETVQWIRTQGHLRNDVLDRHNYYTYIDRGERCLTNVWLAQVHPNYYWSEPERSPHWSWQWPLHTEEWYLSMSESFTLRLSHPGSQICVTLKCSVYSGILTYLCAWCTTALNWTSRMTGATHYLLLINTVGECTDTWYKRIQPTETVEL